MAEESRSAEKDLLKIIENPQAASGRSSQTETPADKKAGKKAGKAAKLPKFAPADLKAALLNRHSVIKILVGITIVVFLYLIYSVIAESEKLKAARSFGGIRVPSQQMSADEQKAGLASSVDLGALTDGPLRNIFRPKKAVEETPKVDQTAEVIKNYKLVGLAFEPEGEESQAMIENTTSNVTFFVKRGEVLEGMEILDILEDRLVLKVNGVRTELR